MSASSGRPDVSGVPDSVGSLVRLPALDGLRALAILLVIPHNADLLPSADEPGGWVLRHFYALGWMGVQLFFVLSGYLITRILRGSRDTPGYFRTFYLRRALRILPAYYFIVAIGLVLLPAISTMPAEFEASRDSFSVAAVLLFFSNWAQPLGHGIYGFGHLWSLAVEEQFYLVWPAVICLVNRAPLMRVVGVAVLCFPLLRFAMLQMGASPDMLYQFTLSRMDALLCGAWVALALEDPRASAALRRWCGVVAVAALVAILAILGLAHGLDKHAVVTQVAGYSVLSLGLAAWMARVVMVSQGGTPGLATRILSVRQLGSIGFHSYGMYLVHQPLSQWWAREAFIGAWPGGVPGSLGSVTYSVLLTGASYALAVVLYRVIERPALKLRETVARSG